VHDPRFGSTIVETFQRATRDRPAASNTPGARIFTWPRRSKPKAVGVASI
jgi:hypothetical protein